ncbi:hypothetical protein [Pontibacillus litoralis]|uniref:Uncharacterized protein n=1 Tax=Pontibacillus litoralis JSM 072002 TaxID=1385512 RepID=A0A0A5G1G5_9BACI|nr:hypothetical protein [Pontibacillus litoralis]KGX86941.1 hypothetical protein N784_03410 [Pontibacillus litoralis JSM 072002]
MQFQFLMFTIHVRLRSDYERLQSELEYQRVCKHIEENRTKHFFL